MNDFLDHSYVTLMEMDMKKTKKLAAFAYVCPTKLLPEDDIIAGCFGTSTTRSV